MHLVHSHVLYTSNKKGTHADCCWPQPWPLGPRRKTGHDSLTYIGKAQHHLTTQLSGLRAARWKHSRTTYSIHIHANKQTSRGAASRKEKNGQDEKERERPPIWHLHWGPASPASSGLLLSVGAMEGEGRVGGRTRWGGSRAAVRRGLGGAGLSAAPVGETAWKEGQELTVMLVIKKGGQGTTILHANYYQTKRSIENMMYSSR